MAEPKDRVPDIVDVKEVLDLKEKLVGKDLRLVELRLNSRITEVKDDLKKENEQVKKEIEQVKIDLQQDLQSSVSSLKWFVGIFITSGVAITGIIVTLIVALIK